MEDPNEAYAVRAYRRNKDLEERIRALEAERLIYFQANADVRDIIFSPYRWQNRNTAGTSGAKEQ